ncbi:MAG: DnaA/Hda family protein [Vampirovibrionales bacterium]
MTAVLAVETDGVVESSVAVAFPAQEDHDPFRCVDNCWPHVALQLQQSVSSASYQTWLAGLHALGLSQLEGTWVVSMAAESEFKRDWVEKHYRAALVAAWSHVLETDALRLRLVVDASLSNVQMALPALLEVPLSDSTLADSAGPVCSASGEIAPQGVSWVMSLPLNPHWTFDSWVMDEAYPMPTAAARHVAQYPDQGYSPLVIQGPSGTGKSHLLSAVAHSMSQWAQPCEGAKRFSFLTAEQFTNQLMAAFGKKGWDGFRQQFRSLDALFLDGLDFLVGKPRTQAELVLILDALAAQNKPVVVTCQQPLAVLALENEALRSRLMAGLGLRLEPPTVTVLEPVLRLWAQQRQVRVSSVWVSCVAQACSQRPDAMRCAQGAFNQWAAQSIWGSLLEGQNEALGWEQGWVAQYLGQQVAPLANNPEVLLERMAAFFQVSVEALASAQRNQLLVHARQMVVAVLRHKAHLSYSVIGNLLGGRTHSTLVHGVNKIAELRQTDARVAQQWQELLTYLGWAP